MIAAAPQHQPARDYGQLERGVAPGEESVEAPDGVES